MILLLRFCCLDVQPQLLLQCSNLLLHIVNRSSSRHKYHYYSVLLAHDLLQLLCSALCRWSSNGLADCLCHVTVCRPDKGKGAVQRLHKCDKVNPLHYQMSSRRMHITSAVAHLVPALGVRGQLRCYLGHVIWQR